MGRRKSEFNAPAQEASVASFEDANGREYFPRLSFAKLRLIRDKVNVDLGNVEQMGRTWAELLYDDLKALDTVWLAIAADDGTAAGDVSQDDWLAAMDGDRLEAARGALRQAIENFTPPLRRQMLHQGLAAVDETYKKAIADAERRLKVELKKATDKALSSASGTPRPIAPAS